MNSLFLRVLTWIHVLYVKMVPRFQINKRPSPLTTNEDNTIEVIINEVYDNDKDEKEENRKSIFFSGKSEKIAS